MLIGRCLASLRFHYDEKVAIQYILQKDLAECNAIEEEVDGFVQFPLQVASVVFSIFVLELKNGWKVSFRSKGECSAALFAQQYGGNGHFHAAGARVMENISLSKILERLTETAGKLL
jgi:phosphoesterase RecJ-like protein